MIKREVIITGGRDYEDWPMLSDLLDFIKPTHVIQGGANGADEMAREWAEHAEVLCTTIFADWKAHGKSAGPIRNAEMLKLFPQAIVIAFPGGRGTANCVSTAISYNRIILKVVG